MTHWRAVAPWATDAQIEQDLVTFDLWICRQEASVDDDQLVRCFREYVAFEEALTTRVGSAGALGGDEPRAV